MPAERLLARNLVIGVTATAVTLMLLIAATALGFQMRRVTSPHRLADSRDLDYTAIGGGIAPLTADFVRTVLGGFSFESPETRTVVGARTGGEPRPSGQVARTGRVVDTHSLTNDRLLDARLVRSVPFTAKANTRGASRSGEDPSECSSAGSTVWYRYEPERDEALVAYTLGTRHAVVLGVFSGAPDDLGVVGCDTDTSGNALVAFTARAGRSYFFQLAAPLGGGDLVFNLDPHGRTSLVSRSPAGEPSNGGSGVAVSVSGDGRFVAFASTATNLASDIDPTPCVARDPLTGLVVDGPCSHVYVHDRRDGTTQLITMGRDGRPGNSSSHNPFVSNNGRFIVFESAASNLVAGDANRGSDVFFHDRLTGVTELIPASSPDPAVRARENYAGFFFPSVSDDGRHVAFGAPGAHLVEGDTNDDWDVFVFDRVTSRANRASVSSSGRESRDRARTGGLYPSISANGRFVEFISDSASLVDGDTNAADDVFVHDLLKRTTERISVGANGAQGNNRVLVPAAVTRRMSADGRYVAFVSLASNLVPNDTNEEADLFLHDRQTRTTRRLSVSSTGEEARGSTDAATPIAPIFFAMSSDGRYVTFDTTASNIAPGDGPRDWDVFLHDTWASTTTLVTLDTDGGDMSGQAPAMSGDGRVIAYVSGELGDRAASATRYSGSRVYAYEAPRAS